MPSLKEVRNRIKSVSSTQQITKAMKMVAAAKLRRAQDAITQLRPYSLKLSDIIANLTVSGADSEELKAYSQSRPVNKVLIVAVTSDRGLCGGFNSSILKQVSSLISNKYADLAKNGGITILPVGKKSFDFFSKKKEVIVNDEFYLLFANLKFVEAKKAAEYAMDAFRKGEYDMVEIVYNEFKNVATQIVRVEQFLPVLPAEEANVGKKSKVNDYLFEPDKNSILDELIPKSLKVKFYRCLLESNASEHGARMTAMDKATENAGDLLKELKLTYNRSRQAAITKEILEIVGGAEALKGN